MLPVLWHISVEFASCCLWSNHVRPWSWYLVVFVFGDGLVSDCCAGSSVHLSRDWSCLGLGVVGVGSRNGLFYFEEVVDIVEFGGGFGRWRSVVGVVVVVMGRNDVFEAFPGVVFVGGLVEVIY